MVETSVSGREQDAGSAGRLRSRLTSNFCEAVELAGDEGVSAIANGRRGDVVYDDEAAQLGADSSDMKKVSEITMDITSTYACWIASRPGDRG